MNAAAATQDTPRAGRGRGRLILSSILAAGSAAACVTLIDDPMRATAAAIACVCLTLWLLEAVPPFVPTLVLLAAVPLLMTRYGAQHGFAEVLRWPLDPVLALFFGGFVLGAAAQRHGLDQAFAHRLLRWSGGRTSALVALVLGGTAFLSMWMSNVAATAMMIAALAPLVDRDADDRAFRRVVLLAVAVGANLGGMATPIGSGPNALAIAAASPSSAVTFATWMAFAVPLTAVMLALAYLLLGVRFRAAMGCRFAPTAGAPPGSTARAFVVLGLAVVAIAAWLTEPWHGVPSALVAFALAAAIFALGLLDTEDLRRIDWSTLLLIGGGIALGRLLEHAGLSAAIAAELSRPGLPYPALVAGFVAASAGLASVMSNTGSATMLLPIAMAIDPHPPVIALLLALAASFGMPFVISTPQNAMVFGRGVPSRDILRIGGGLMIVGCLLLVVLGRHLHWFIPMR